MAAVGAVKAGATKSSDQPALLKLKVTENDPGLKVSARATDFRIAGTATNNGVVASFFKLTVDGKAISFGLSKGDTSQHVLSKLKKALPKGYEAKVLMSYKNMPPELVIGITKKSSSVPTTKALKAALAEVRKKAPNLVQHWKTSKPASAVLKSVVLEKAPQMGPGYEVIAHLLKSNPSRVYFSAAPKIGETPGGPHILPPPGGFVTRYYGPVTVD